MDKEKTDILIVGGGPAGMMAAISARKANPSAEIHLIEKNEKLGKKLFITGKGRGNLTNTCEEARFLEHVLSNPRFLYPAFHVFNNTDLMRFIEGLDCPLKEERGGRVFPRSDKAYSITDALKRALKEAKVSVECNRTLKAIKRREEGFLCNVGGKELFCKKLILATGDTLVRTEELVKDLPFDQVYTDLKPDGKFELVEELQKAGHTILMVGDGLNDSAALTLSDIGVVMNESADISKQMSDILLLDNRLDFFQELDWLSSSLQTLIKKNIQDTVVVNSSLIGFGLFNWLSPSNLSILHNLTTLRIVLRSLSIKG